MHLQAQAASGLQEPCIPPRAGSSVCLQSSHHRGTFRSLGLQGTWSPALALLLLCQRGLICVSSSSPCRGRLTWRVTSPGLPCPVPSNWTWPIGSSSGGQREGGEKGQSPQGPGLPHEVARTAAPGTEGLFPFLSLFPSLHLFPLPSSSLAPCLSLVPS